MEITYFALPVKRKHNDTLKCVEVIKKITLNTITHIIILKRFIKWQEYMSDEELIEMAEDYLVNFVYETRNTVFIQNHLAGNDI